MLQRLERELEGVCDGGVGDATLGEIHALGQALRFFVCDEARIGQKGTLTRVWARRGSRPTLVKQCEYDWVYLWAAVDPACGNSIAMITPTVNTELMQTFIDGLSGHVKADQHAILVLDNA